MDFGTDLAGRVSAEQHNNSTRELTSSTSAQPSVTRHSSHAQQIRIQIGIDLGDPAMIDAVNDTNGKQELPKDQQAHVSSSSAVTERLSRILRSASDSSIRSASFLYPSSPGNPCADASLLDTYNAYLESRPVLTKALTAATVQGLGAALGSILSSRRSRGGTERRGGRRVDWLEVFAFALHGGLLNGPIGHYWFEWIDKNGPKSKSKSMLLDQLCVQPPLLFVMFVFLDMTKAAVREIPPSCGRTLSNIGPTIVSSWRFWPFAVWATFKYLKKKHYTVALNLCSIAWTIYLSKGNTSAE